MPLGKLYESSLNVEGYQQQRLCGCLQKQSDDWGKYSVEVLVEAAQRGNTSGRKQQYMEWAHRECEGHGHRRLICK